MLRLRKLETRRLECRDDGDQDTREDIYSYRKHCMCFLVNDTSGGSEITGGLVIQSMYSVHN